MLRLKFIFLPLVLLLPIEAVASDVVPFDTEFRECMKGDQNNRIKCRNEMTNLSMAECINVRKPNKHTCRVFIRRLINDYEVFLKKGYPPVTSVSEDLIEDCIENSTTDYGVSIMFWCKKTEFEAEMRENKSIYWRKKNAES